MAIPTPPDPFLDAQSDLLSTLQQTRSLHSSYLRIRSLASSAASPELNQALQELKSALEDLGTDLQDLVDSVNAVEGDPYRYGIDEEEVGRRRQLVKSVGDEVEEMREQVLESTEHAASKSKTKPNTALKGSAELPAPATFDSMGGAQLGDNSNDDDDDEYAAFEQQRQVEMMHEQDHQLDGVFKTVGNLRAQADTMGRELEEQVGMVQDADQIADRVGGKLQTGIQKIGWVIKKNEGLTTLSVHLLLSSSLVTETWSSCCIGLLILVLVMLLVLVIVL